MTVHQLAKEFLSAKNRTEASKILSGATEVSGLELAYAIKEICYDSWANEPTVAQKTASALRLLSKLSDETEIGYVADWVTGISEITKGNLKDALVYFESAHAGFTRLGKKYDAAQTQVAKLIPLGLLGEYEHAISVGKQALETFEALQDSLSAGKIEMNLANILERQGKYRESMEFCVSARNRFEALDETKWLLMAENDLARELAILTEFDEAEERYLNALEISRQEGQDVTEAEILASLGNLQTFRGQYGKALRSLELSRKKYIDLEMPHHSVIADLEMAEIYQILNLTDEAREIYETVTDELKRFGMRAEEAWARVNYGQLSLAVGDIGRAETELKRAAELYTEVGNPAGAGSVKLRQAKLLTDRGQYENALDELDIALKFIKECEFKRLEIECRYLQGEILRLLGRTDRATSLLGKVISDAMNSEQLGIVANCHVSLAKIAIADGNLDQAEDFLREAVSTVEHLRAPIPAEEFRMAFLADKLAPFELSERVNLHKGDLEMAFCFTERARSRTLFEKLDAPDMDRESKSPASIEYIQLRETLNWNYSSLAREAGDDKFLRDEIVRIETKLAEIARIDSSVLDEIGNHEAEVDWSALPERLLDDLGKDRALIEYTIDGDNISAYVVDKNGIDHFENIGKASELTNLVEGLRFQFETMRYEGIDGFEDQLKERADGYLAALYDMLVGPLLGRLECRNLVIVPVGPVFYVPFCGLFDGREYFVESNTVCFAPSAAIWSKLSDSEMIQGANSLVVSYADDKSPLIEQEAEEVSKIVENSKVFSGAEASLENYFAHSEQAKIVHLACHGEFRADSPLFSNLRLADGFLTVRDIAGQRLSADLVTLSACETGLNKVYAGEEILGLARGFLGAGANRLLISLWAVNDEATSVLMKGFYGSLVSGENPVKALQSAQKHLISADKHPYYWAPFAIIGK